MPPIDRIRSPNVQDSIYAALRASIISLNLAPGTVISEKEISQRFNVSRTPVREAFIHLSKEGLIKVMPQKGSMVSRIDFTRVAQELFLRENLEPAALKQFIKNYQNSQLQELEKCMELQTEAAGTKKYEQFYRYDNMFHQVFFSSQQVAWEILENMCGHYNRVRLLTIWLQDIVKDIVKEHKQLFQAVKKRDETKALVLLESHIHKLGAEEAMLRRLFPDFFSEPEEVLPPVDFGGLNIN